MIQSLAIAGLWGAVSTTLGHRVASSLVDPSIDSYEARRQSMVETVGQRGIADERVLSALSKVPRHQFVPAELRYAAYDDRSVNIGYGQLITQPFYVALMTESLDISNGMRVLDVGTGRGYQAAVSAEMGARVTSVEVVSELARIAKETLSGTVWSSSISVVAGDCADLHAGDGQFGGILVAASAPAVPDYLWKHLAVGGRLVMPVGDPSAMQMLHLFERVSESRVAMNQLGPAQFVPLVS